MVLENYGRILQAEKDVLHGYKLDEVEITDAEVLQKSGKQFHPIAIKTNNPKDTIEGTIFQITEEELVQSDAYEVTITYVFQKLLLREKPLGFMLRKNSHSVHTYS